MSNELFCGLGVAQRERSEELHKAIVKCFYRRREWVEREIDFVRSTSLAKFNDKFTRCSLSYFHDFFYDNIKGIQRLQLNTSPENCQFHLLDLFIIYLICICHQIVSSGQGGIYAVKTAITNRK